MRRSTVRAGCRGFLALALLVAALTVATSWSTTTVSKAAGSSAVSARDGRAIAPLGVTVERPAPEWIRGTGSRPTSDESGVPAVLVAALLATAALLAWLALSATDARRLTRRRLRSLGRAPPALRFA